MSTYHQLIIIGNGFDLACGLRSSYSDFFQSRLQQIDKVKSSNQVELKKVVDKYGLTVWDFILKGNDISDWCNVEKAIANWTLLYDENNPKTPVHEFLPYVVMSHSNSFTFPIFEYTELPFDIEVRKLDPKLKQIFEYRARDGRIWNRISDDSYLTMRDYSMLIGVAEFVLCKQIDLYLIMKSRGYNLINKDEHALLAHPSNLDFRHQLLAFLRSELDVVENKFRNYLLEETRSNVSYHNEAKDLISKLIEDEPSSQYGLSDEASIVSFNYTRPFQHSGSPISEKECVNIHGSLDDAIIFGIDGKDCMDDLDVLPFTKTYRITLRGTEVTADFIRGANYRDQNSRTRTIKFFGHSLAEADYSYFQSIFDEVNLYGGDTKLIFYYRPWTGKEEEELRAATVQRVSRLLNAYGSSLDNKDHGKNLMHRLLLEGRLKVKKI